MQPTFHLVGVAALFCKLVKNLLGERAIHQMTAQSWRTVYKILEGHHQHVVDGTVQRLIRCRLDGKPNAAAALCEGDDPRRLRRIERPAGKIQVFVFAHFAGELTVYCAFDIVNAEGAGQIDLIPRKSQLRKRTADLLRVPFFDHIQERVGARRHTAKFLMHSAPQSDGQLLYVDGLEAVVRHLQFDPAAGVFEIRITCQQDDGQLAVLFPHALAQLQPIHFRHSNVRDQDVHRISLNKIKRLFPIGCRTAYFQAELPPRHRGH